MTKLDDLGFASDDLLSRARIADTMLWSTGRSERLEWMAIRDRAIRDALSAGYTRDDVASALGIRVDDVNYILSGLRRA